MKRTKKTLLLTQTALIAAVYVVLTLALPVFSYGAVQCRISEAMTILPLFTPLAIPGLTLGCALANLIGFATGLNPLGLFDTPFGASATLIAACLTYLAGRIPNKKLHYLLAPLPPVLLNAIIIGLEITFFGGETATFPLFVSSALSVGAGEAVACFGLGIPLIVVLKKNSFLQKFIKQG